ncbi:transcriptional regulator with AAA-type ATPase domain [Enterococcus sp. PF1-24]|uniref:DNA-binding protein n=1 Tax=unclassified Enterococcus TaxID=2608891 RepID=UPI002475A6FE|nr:MULTISPECIES: DNA-binding protein [unclassified Enterococcus]MDH6363278.1 transcriptional regulator with AAA-type ATPase domain [Enterococcus sp. PFB1-1]MDH6400421.1 transcriptional regulator with AAA-type ATPase domain [Enterococcus sp. PF1-24]
MAKLSIDELDLSPALREVIKETAAKEGRQQAITFIEEYKKKLEQPAVMNYTQAAKYLGTSYNTLTKKLIKNGLIKVILVDGYERISKAEADRFLKENAK